MAVLGALLLGASLLAGGHPGAGPNASSTLTAQTAESVPAVEPTQPANVADDGVAAQAVKSSRKKFRVKLFLFRH